MILGHRPGASDESYELNEKQRKRKYTYQNYLIEAAQDRVFQIVSVCDKELTKDSESIISDHADFFNSIKQVHEVVIIGHSMSPVDWDYFEKIVSEMEDIHNVIWYIGVHDLNDFRNMEALVLELNIERKNIVLFRTDVIHVNCFYDNVSTTAKEITGRIVGESSDKKWQAKSDNVIFQIIDLEENHVVYKLIMASYVNEAFFDQSGKYLFAIIRGLNEGVILFTQKGGTWAMVNELTGIPNQGILNRRLKKVFLNDTRITFVYNSRVRRYSLADGQLVDNSAVRNAALRDYTMDGVDVSKWFVI